MRVHGVCLCLLAFLVEETSAKMMDDRGDPAWMALHTVRIRVRQQFDT